MIHLSKSMSLALLTNLTSLVLLINLYNCNVDHFLDDSPTLYQYTN